MNPLYTLVRLSDSVSAISSCAFRSAVFSGFSTRFTSRPFALA